MSELHRTEDRIIAACRTIDSLWGLMHVGPSGVSAHGSPSSDVVNGLDRRVSLAHEVTALVNSWCRLVIEERGTQHGIPLGTDVPMMLTFLQRHARWLSGHESGPDAADELTKMADRVRTCAVGPSTRRFVIGSCPVVIEDAACPGSLFAVFHLEQTLLPAEVLCAAHLEHRWSPREWIHLGSLVLSVTGERIVA